MNARGAYTYTGACRLSMLERSCRHTTPCLYVMVMSIRMRGDGLGCDDLVDRRRPRVSPPHHLTPQTAKAQAQAHEHKARHALVGLFRCLICVGESLGAWACGEGRWEGGLSGQQPSATMPSTATRTRGSIHFIPSWMGVLSLLNQPIDQEVMFIKKRSVRTTTHRWGCIQAIQSVAQPTIQRLNQPPNNRSTNRSSLGSCGGEGRRGSTGWARPSSWRPPSWSVSRRRLPARSSSRVR